MQEGFGHTEPKWDDFSVPSGAFRMVEDMMKVLDNPDKELMQPVGPV